MKKFCRRFFFVNCKIKLNRKNSINKPRSVKQIAQNREGGCLWNRVSLPQIRHINQKGKHLSFEKRVMIQTRLRDGCSFGLYLAFILPKVFARFFCFWFLPTRSKFLSLFPFHGIDINL